MLGHIEAIRSDVAVFGGGAAGVAAAVAAAKTGAQTVLVEAGAAIGGDAISGLPLLGCCNSLGRWIVGGVACELINACDDLGGYVGCIFDWRTMWGVCCHPDAMRLAVAGALEHYGVRVLLNSPAVEVFLDDTGGIEHVVASGRGEPIETHAGMYIDCTGDGDVADLAGAPSEIGDGYGRLQPVSIVFQMAGIDVPRLLEWVRHNPDDLLVAENPIIDKSPAECAAAIADGGYPYFAISALGPMLREAIDAGEIDPCAAVFMSPTCMETGEVVLNATRIADVDATDPAELSGAYLPLHGQVRRAVGFMRRRVPGFEAAVLSRIAPRIGVRETRRIFGEELLREEDVVSGRKRDDGIAKGGHHVDIHGGGTDQTRVPIAGGQSYDIPFGCLLPKLTSNLLTAGRCISSTRPANGSARVMGTCMATGHAAGTAAAMCIARGLADPRELPVTQLRQTLIEQGAVLEGTQ